MSRELIHVQMYKLANALDKRCLFNLADQIDEILELSNVRTAAFLTEEEWANEVGYFGDNFHASQNLRHTLMDMPPQYIVKAGLRALQEAFYYIPSDFPGIEKFKKFLFEEEGMQLLERFADGMHLTVEEENRSIDLAEKAYNDSSKMGYGSWLYEDWVPRERVTVTRNLFSRILWLLWGLLRMITTSQQSTAQLWSPEYSVNATEKYKNVTIVLNAIQSVYESVQMTGTSASGEELTSSLTNTIRTNVPDKYRAISAYEYKEDVLPYHEQEVQRISEFVNNIQPENIGQEFRNNHDVRDTLILETGKLNNLHMGIRDPHLREQATSLRLWLLQLTDTIGEAIGNDDLHSLSDLSRMLDNLYTY